MKIIEFYIEVIFQVLIIGHSLYFIINPLFKKYLEKSARTLFFPKIENRIILVFGIIYVLSFAILTIYRLTNSDVIGINYKERILGHYAFAYWIFLLINLAIIIIRQLNFKMRPILLFIFSFMSLVPMEKVIITMAMNRDYFPSTIGHNSILEIVNIWMPIIRNYFICLIIYYIIVEFIYRLKNNNANQN